MPETRCLVLLAILLTTTPLTAAEPQAWQPPDGTAAQQGRFQLDGRSFHIRVPTFDAGDELDLLIWCHPGSGRSQPEFRWWQRMPSAIDEHTVLLCPQAKGRGWIAHDDDVFVAALLQRVVADLPIAKDRIVLGGHSSGAFYTYDFGLRHQTNFAALLPAAGFATGRIPPPHREQAPQVCIYHSRNDQVVPWERMAQTKQTLERLGYAVDLTEDDAQHNITPPLAERYVRLRDELRAAEAQAE